MDECRRQRKNGRRTLATALGDVETHSLSAAMSIPDGFGEAGQDADSVSWVAG
jgi:hypothetical protein